MANDPPTQPDEALETSEVEVGPLLLGWMNFEGTSPKIVFFLMGSPKTGCKFGSSNPLKRRPKDEQALPVKAPEAQTRQRGAW